MTAFGNKRPVRTFLIAGLLLLAIVVLRPGRASLPLIAPSGALDGNQPQAPLAGDFEARQLNIPTVAPPLPKSPQEIPAAITDHLRIVALPGSYSQAQAAALAEPLEQALAYVAKRTAMQLKEPVKVVFDRHADVCGLDGVAYTERRVIVLYACPDTPTRRAVNILAHEFVHQLAHDHYGDAHLQADLMLSEGLATWGAGDYWLGGQADFRHFVARNYAPALLPLHTHYNNAPAADAQNRLYYEWASFIEWTLATRDRAAFDDLYRNGKARGIGSAPYKEVFGAEMTDVEAAWQTWIKDEG